MSSAMAVAQANQTFVQTPADALKLWLSMANKYAQHGNGIIFCPSNSACDPYVRSAYQILPPHHYKVRSFNGGAGYLLGTGGALDVSVVASEDDAYAHAARSWPFMVFHDPASWPEPKIMGYLTSLLRTPQNIQTVLVTVASPLLAGVAVPELKPVPTIDYAEITRAVAGGGA